MALGGAGERPQVGRRASQWEIREEQSRQPTGHGSLGPKGTIAWKPSQSYRASLREGGIGGWTQRPQGCFGDHKGLWTWPFVPSLISGTLLSTCLCLGWPFSPAFTLKSFVYPSRSISHSSHHALWASLVAQQLKKKRTTKNDNPPAMWETWVRYLSWKIPWRRKQQVFHSRTLAWKIPRTEEPAGLQSLGLQRVGLNLATKWQAFSVPWEAHRPLNDRNGAF